MLYQVVADSNSANILGGAASMLDLILVVLRRWLRFAVARSVGMRDLPIRESPAGGAFFVPDDALVEGRFLLRPEVVRHAGPPLQTGVSRTFGRLTAATTLGLRARCRDGVSRWRCARRRDCSTPSRLLQGVRVLVADRDGSHTARSES